MPILDSEAIPSEIKDQIEALAFDIAKGLVWVADSQPGPDQDTNPAPSDTDPRLTILAQGLQRGLTAIAMMVLPG